MTQPKSKPAGYAPLANRLLTPPASFSREHKERYQHSMYSGKLARYIHCEGRAQFALVIWLEVDVDVRKFNETPPELDVTTDEGKSRLARPDAVSLGTKTVPTIHVIGGGDTIQLDWASWASSHDCLLKTWTLSDLQIDSVLMSNRERLLRFSAHAGVLPNLGLQDQVIAELKMVKTMTVHALMRRIFGHDDQVVFGAIAAVVLKGLVAASIAEEEFDLTTELRVQRV